MSIAESLRKANYLRPLVDSLKEFQRQREYEDGINQLSQLYNQAGQNINQQFQPSLAKILGVKSGQGFAPQITPVNPLQRNVSGQTNVVEQPTNVPEPTYNVPVEKTIEKPVNYGEAQKNALNILSGTNINALKLFRDNPQLQGAANYLSQNLGQQIQNNMPPKPERFTIGEGGISVTADPYNGQEISRIENVKDFKPEAVQDKKIDEFVGDDGQKYLIMQSGDGKRQAINAVTGQPAPEGVKVRDGQDGTSVALQSLIYRMMKDEEEKAKKENQAQGEYNTVMGSQWLSNDELIKQGYLKENDLKKLRVVDENGNYKKDPNGNYVYDFKYGGAYVVPSSNGKDVTLKYTSEGLEDVARTKVPEAPNKWNRNKKKTTDNDPLGLR